MTVKAVQAQLQPEELVLEYVLAEPDSFVLAITSHSLRKYDLPSSKAIASLATQYRKDIHDRKRGVFRGAEVTSLDGDEYVAGANSG